MNSLFKEKAKLIQPPQEIGSYPKEDCQFLLKEVTDIVEETTLIREEKMTRGVHYSEMLPIEELPSQEYVELYRNSLTKNAQQVAQYVANISETILLDKGTDVVLVSLARAGTPIGVLVKRYLAYRYQIDVPHYSVSIIRGKGIDENALMYLLQAHPNKRVQFIDGWTGKGVIGDVLGEAIQLFNQTYGVNLSDDLAVIADPAYSSAIYGTRDDFYLPSSSLNAVVSGLVSRTIHQTQWNKTIDFHGVKVYHEWKEKDVSLSFVETVESYFPNVVVQKKQKDTYVPKLGYQYIENIQKEFGICDVNKIKPSVGETTRVLLRRMPWKILIKNPQDSTMSHVQYLAQEKNVPIVIYPNMSYSCVGLIKEV